jgi:serine/threonine protein kinase
MPTRSPELIVKVIDFGLAKAAVAADETDLTYGGFVGTPVFASPEQFTGSGVDVRCDIYSLGATLWMMLTGRAAFTGSPAEVMYQHQRARACRSNNSRDCRSPSSFMNAPQPSAVIWSIYLAMPARDCSEHWALKETRRTCEMPLTNSGAIVLP